MEVRSPKLVSSEDRTVARAPSASYCSTKGVAPLHTAPPVPVCTTSAGGATSAIMYILLKYMHGCHQSLDWGGERMRNWLVKLSIFRTSLPSTQSREGSNYIFYCSEHLEDPAPERCKFGATCIKNFMYWIIIREKTTWFVTLLFFLLLHFFSRDWLAYYDSPCSGGGGGDGGERGKGRKILVKVQDKMCNCLILLNLSADL